MKFYSHYKYKKEDAVYLWNNAVCEIWVMGEFSQGDQLKIMIFGMF